MQIMHKEVKINVIIKLLDNKSSMLHEYVPQNSTFKNKIEDQWTDY